VAIDPGVVVNPAQARSLLAAVTYARPRGQNRSWLPFFATLYFAGTRPGEARFLAEQHCHLPSSGWGELVLPNSLGKSAARYNDGEMYQVRPLKHRPEEATRHIPIPPQLVGLLSEHIDRAGTGADGRLFQTADGGPIPNSSYTDIWRRARPFGLAPNQVASSLASRPYDLRHAAVSSWIAAGVPLPEIARRAGHTVQMLTAVYAKVIFGSADQMNRKIETFLDGLD
jgi:integrase